MGGVGCRAAVFPSAWTSLPGVAVRFSQGTESLLSSPGCSDTAEPRQCLRPFPQGFWTVPGLLNTVFLCLGPLGLWAPWVVFPLVTWTTPLKTS